LVNERWGREGLGRIGESLKGLESNEIFFGGLGMGYTRKGLGRIGKSPHLVIITQFSRRV